jgi:hypothetical protein
VTLEELAQWVQRNPNELGCVAFHAARMVERDALPYWPTFDRVLAAGVDSGIPQAVARKWTLRGFLATAFHAEPPALLGEEPPP